MRLLWIPLPSWLAFPRFPVSQIPWVHEDIPLISTECVKHIWRAGQSPRFLLFFKSHLKHSVFIDLPCLNVISLLSKSPIKLYKFATYLRVGVCIKLQKMVENFQFASKHRLLQRQRILCVLKYWSNATTFEFCYLPTSLTIQTSLNSQFKGC